MLEEILKKPENSVVREKLFKNRFLYDLQLSFLKNGHSILCYESDYDKDGFDLVLDNLNKQLHLQMKSIMNSSKRTKFDVHRTLLRPRLRDVDKYPLSNDYAGVGYGGGVILIVAKEVESGLDITYRYCDGLILSAFGAGLFRYRNTKINDSVLKVFKDYQDYRKVGGQITLTKSCFLEFTSLAKLVEYMELDYSSVGTRHVLLMSMSRTFGKTSDFDIPFESLEKLVVNKFKKSINWQGLDANK